MLCPPHPLEPDNESRWDHYTQLPGRPHQPAVCCAPPHCGTPVGFYSQHPEMGRGEGFRPLSSSGQLSTALGRSSPLSAPALLPCPASWEQNPSLRRHRVRSTCWAEGVGAQARINIPCDTRTFPSNLPQVLAQLLVECFPQWEPHYFPRLVRTPAFAQS